MQAIGERLREARMRQGLDISEVEIATKIRAKYLRALENDEFGMLPGRTYVKSFLRTYAEYLGLDAQLLVEEFRAQHEPRGEGESQILAPPARARPPRERRVAPGGPPFGPGTALLLGVLLLLVLFAIIGLASGGGGNGKKEASKPPSATKKQGKQQHSGRSPAPAPARTPRAVKLKIVPVELTYLCLDDGAGTKLFEGTVTSPQSFRGKRLRINLGRSSARVYVNGKRVQIPLTSGPVGYSFSRTGHVTALPLANRPCR
jgi:cytoskeleton protein RodZ